MRALIVEDEPIFRMDLAMRLRALGFTAIAETAYAGQSIEMACADPYDLILMDIRLKDDVTGIEAATEIARSQSTAIVIMSAYDVDEEALRGTIPTLHSYVPKPVSDAQLRHAIVAVSGGSTES